MSRVVFVGGREGGGAWWLPAGGICASQGTFSGWIKTLISNKTTGFEYQDKQ